MEKIKESIFSFIFKKKEGEVSPSLQPQQSSTKCKSKQKDLVICGALLCLPLPPLRGYPATPQENNLGLSLARVEKADTLASFVCTCYEFFLTLR